MERSTFTTGRLLPIRLISQRTFFFPSLSDLRSWLCETVTAKLCSDVTVVVYVVWNSRASTVVGLVFKLKKRAAWFFPASRLPSTCSGIFPSSILDQMKMRSCSLKEAFPKLNLLNLLKRSIYSKSEDMYADARFICENHWAVQSVQCEISIFKSLRCCGRCGGMDYPVRTTKPFLKEHFCVL